jgi:hypothetical protein
MTDKVRVILIAYEQVPQSLTVNFTTILWTRRCPEVSVAKTFKASLVSFTVCALTIVDIPYILESNPHLVFATFLNEKKLVHASNPHLSFNRPLPTGRLFE